MANEKETGPAVKVLLKLRDKSSIFNDPSQGKSITGYEVAEFKKTPRVARAIAGTQVLIADKDDLAAWEERKKAHKAENATVAREAATKAKKDAEAAEQAAKEAEAAEKEAVENKGGNKGAK